MRRIRTRREYKAEIAALRRTNEWYEAWIEELREEVNRLKRANPE